MPPKRLQQGLGMRGMGFHGRFAQQQSETTNVRFGSKADIQGVEPMSAITPKATAKADIAMGYERDPKLG